jgi:hypothetical protein
MGGRRLGRYIAIALCLLGGATVAMNAHTLAEGLRYLRQMAAWTPEDVVPLDPDGPFGPAYPLAEGTNAERFALVERHLRRAGLEPVAIPVPESETPNLLVLFGDEGPYTLWAAHYDKSRETPSYQGASDNTAAVAVLLAAAQRLAEEPPERPVALLFSAAEERGMLGARAFVEWMVARELAVQQVIALDMLGRDGIAARPAADPGLYFWLPLAGRLVYDGRGVSPGRPYALPPATVIAPLRDVLDDELIVYRRFTACGDANVFEQAGLPATTLSSSNLYYLDCVWERDADRIELLDERNLALALGLIMRHAGLGDVTSH